LKIDKTEEIRLAHGVGGRFSHELIEEVFLPILGNEYLNPLDDSAVLDKIKVPKDESHLISILSDLEELKMRTDEIINSYLESIVNTKTREKLEHQLWAEIIKCEVLWERK